ncbi:hypothetical protein [Photorhabdus stackebrandtii]|uniref:Uncharacterized protein n=1 Tax=Photorhabdus stackebrandtii TaxID=1123042 RepID=A0A7X5QQ11_9GAMM|nr:hypothetical protein [Photorhabdus stackebrandtii]NHB98422.1 hypothetical protein [Photorhabdus stackebrandtii]
MTVELVDKDQNIPSLGLPNGTWFAVLNIPGVETLFSTQKTNDPIDCSRSKARKLADLINRWIPPEGWFSDIGAEKGKEYLIDFFCNCKGFRTH